MKQRSFASLSSESKKTAMRRERLMGEMAKVARGKASSAVISVSYPMCGRRGCPSMAASIVPCIDFMQNWYALIAPVMGCAPYAIESVRQFAGLESWGCDPTRDDVPQDSAPLGAARSGAPEAGHGPRARRPARLAAAAGHDRGRRDCPARSSTQSRDKRSPDMRRKQQISGAMAYIRAGVASRPVRPVPLTSLSDVDHSGWNMLSRLKDWVFAGSLNRLLFEDRSNARRVNFAGEQNSSGE
jgi:hypothetical protein